MNSASRGARCGSRSADVPGDIPRLGMLRELGARLGHALVKVDRVLLHVDVATRPLAEVKHAIRAYWSTFNDHPDQWRAGLMGWEQRLLHRWVRPGDRLLLIGCGSGRELHAMLEHGCEVVGVEPSGETLDIARAALGRAGRSALLVQGFVEDVDLPGIFDVCWFSYFSYSYIPDRRRREALLRRLSEHLGPGGRVVLTCLSQSSPPRSRALAIGRAAGRIARSDWEMAPGDELLRGAPAYRVFHYQHVFSPAEVAREAEAGGLEVAAAHPPEAFVLQIARHAG
jgi:SAM-dependent methyltransferase